MIFDNFEVDGEPQVFYAVIRKKAKGISIPGLSKTNQC